MPQNTCRSGGLSRWTAATQISLVRLRGREEARQLRLHLRAIAAEPLKARPRHAFSAGLPLELAVAGRGERRKRLHSFRIAGCAVNKRPNIHFVIGKIL